MFNHDVIDFEVQKVPLYTDHGPGHPYRGNEYPADVGRGVIVTVPTSLGVGIQREDNG